MKLFGGFRAANIAKLDIGNKQDTINTPAAFLFPADNGTGLCTYALTILLVDTHNSLVRSDLPPIHPYNVGPGHLASVTKSQMQSLLLSHTRYSLSKNGVTREEYDISAMNRNIKERLVEQLFFLF